LEGPLAVTCPKCGKIFAHSSSKSRHVKQCKSVALTSITTHNVHQSASATPAPTTVINNSGTINNIVNTININILGKEDLSFITEQTTERLAAYVNNILAHRMPMRGVCEFMVTKHFDNDHPENQNIRKVNRKDHFIDCHDGQSWKTCFYTEALEQIMDNVRKNFEDFVNRIFDNNGKINKGNLDKFMAEVGEPLGMDITGEDYDWSYDMTDEEKTAKRERLYSIACEYIYQNTRKMAHLRWSAATKATPLAFLNGMHQ
jgi:hypothetical protein